MKREISLKGGLVDLVWDGNLKRQAVGDVFHQSSSVIQHPTVILDYIYSFQVKSEWRESQQEQFSRRLKVD